MLRAAPASSIVYGKPCLFEPSTYFKTGPPYFIDFPTACHQSYPRERRQIQWNTCEAFDRCLSINQHV